MHVCVGGGGLCMLYNQGIPKLCHSAVGVADG